MSKTRSIRLIDELDAPVDKLPRGAFSFITNRLLQLYFADEKIRAAVDNVKMRVTMRAPEPRPVPDKPDPAPAPAPAPEPEPVATGPEEYNLLDSIVPR